MSKRPPEFMRDRNEEIFSQGYIFIYDSYDHTKLSEDSHTLAEEDTSRVGQSNPKRRNAILQTHVFTL